MDLLARVHGYDRRIWRRVRWHPRVRSTGNREPWSWWPLCNGAAPLSKSQSDRAYENGNLLPSASATTDPRGDTAEVFPATSRRYGMRSEQVAWADLPPMYVPQASEHATSQEDAEFAARLDGLITAWESGHGRPLQYRSLVEALAHRGQVTSASYVSMLRRGHRRHPRPELVEALAEFFDADAHWLRTGIRRGSGAPTSVPSRPSRTTRCGGCCSRPSTCLHRRCPCSPIWPSGSGRATPTCRRSGTRPA